MPKFFGRFSNNGFAGVFSIVLRVASGAAAGVRPFPFFPAYTKDSIDTGKLVRNCQR